MYINSIGTAVPETAYSQADCWEALKNSPPFAGLRTRSHGLLRKVLLGENGIESRHLALDPLSQAFDLNPDTLHARFEKHAPLLAAKAVRNALAKLNFPLEKIDGLIISTCTGYLCPGLTSYVAESLGLRPEIMLWDLVGQGCGAAIPNLRLANSVLKSGRCRHVVSICVEICSAAFYLDDDPGVLVSACLFGDGAAALLLSNESMGDRNAEWISDASLHVPRDRDLLRFEQKGGMLRNLLSLRVPEMASGAAWSVCKSVLEEQSINSKEVAEWLFHAGGRDVLLGLQKEFSLEPSQIPWSWEVLKKYGNLSSPSVLFALNEALEGGGKPGFWYLTSFGAGFSCHGAVLRVS